MNDTDPSQYPPIGSEPETRAPETPVVGDIESPGAPADGTSYLWRPMEPPLAMVNSDEMLRHRLCQTGTTPSPMVTASM